MDNASFEAMNNPSFEINRLPPEIRDMIWEHTLPPARLFHIEHLCEPAEVTPEIEEVYRTWFGVEDLSVYQKSQICQFQFLNRHKPPVATQVCQESRNAARRAGFFVLPAMNTEGWVWESLTVGVAWFGGHTDILYHTLPSLDDFIISWTYSNYIVRRPALYLPNSERVRNVGVEWRALLCAPLPQPESIPEEFDVETVWREQLLALYDYSPGLQTIYMILPTGAEPSPTEGDWNDSHYCPDQSLSPLDPWETIPTLFDFPTWDRVSNEFPTWEEILEPLEEEIETAYDPQEMKLEFGDNVRYPPKIEGLQMDWEW